MSDHTATDLLQRLACGTRDAAWTEFLARYSPLILRVIGRHEGNHELARDCFEHVCGALSDAGFRRLLGFRPDGPARFDTWLMAVVSNLCVDWRRTTAGRLRPPRCVARLPELDQDVYHCLYECGMSRTRCVECLVPRYPALTLTTVSEINARLFALLTPQQRWQLSARTAARQPVACGVSFEDDEGPASRVADPDPLPEDVVASLQQRRQLQAALSELPVDQRLLLRLRYEQGLTLAEVARLTGQPDPFRANRQIQVALARLAELMTESHGGRPRKS